MLSYLATIALAAVILPSGSSAHYFFPNFIAGGVSTDYFEYVREHTTGFMPQKGTYDSLDFRCNVGSLQNAGKTGVYEIEAGSEIGFATDFGAQIQHPGPLLVYMSKAPGDVHDYDGSGGWFKIYEVGPKAFTSDGIEWGTTGLSNFTFTVPKATPPGQYLVRIEHIALHGALVFGQAELYMNCAQINVTGTGTGTPLPIVEIPGVYTGREPGILFDMYYPIPTNYTMPGPAVWTGDNSGDDFATTSAKLAAPSTSLSTFSTVASSSTIPTASVVAASSTLTIALVIPSSSNLSSKSLYTSKKCHHYTNSTISATKPRQTTAFAAKPFVTNSPSTVTVTVTSCIC